ncbi:hypothetical protein EVA_21870, partial [gut metagenome]
PVLIGVGPLARLTISLHGVVIDLPLFRILP